MCIAYHTIKILSAKTYVFISGVALCGALGAKDEEGMMQGYVNTNPHYEDSADAAMATSG